MPGPEVLRGSQLQSPPPEGASCVLMKEGERENIKLRKFTIRTGINSLCPFPYSFSILFDPIYWLSCHLPSRRSEAEPRQYSITS